jgi:hypothetical protein
VIVLASSKDDGRYDMKLLETKIDICRVNKGVRNSIFSKVLYENFEESMSAAAKKGIECPAPKGEIKAVNFTITSNFLPPFPKLLFPSGQVRFKIVCHHHAKVENIRKLVRIYTYTLTGVIFDGETNKFV